MDINPPALTEQKRAEWKDAHALLDLSQEQVDNLRRHQYSTLMTTVHAPYYPLDGVWTEENQHFRGKSFYEVMCLRVMQQATEDKPDMRAVEFVQEHTMGKAVQRVESQNVTYTYQDLLAKSAAAEKRFAKTKSQFPEHEDIVDVEPQAPSAWDALL